MKRPILLGLTLTAPLLAACFQTVDTSVANPPPNSVFTSSSSGGGGGTGLPPAFGNPDLTQQCEAGSALCYQLCGSPECALVAADGGLVLPTTIQTPAVVLPEGGTSTDPCDDVRARALDIRQHACAQCHDTSGPGTSIWHWVMDDQQLMTMNAPGLSTPLIIPGKPADSLFYQRILGGISGSQTGMPLAKGQATGIVSSAIAETIVYPTPEDVSVLYGWILNCLPNADGGAYTSDYYGGNYAPDGGGGVATVRDAGGGG